MESASVISCTVAKRHSHRDKRAPAGFKPAREWSQSRMDISPFRGRGVFSPDSETWSML